MGLDAETLGERHEVGVAESRPEGLVAVVALFLADEAVVVVPEDDDGERPVESGGRLQFGGVHQEPAVAGDGHDLLLDGEVGRHRAGDGDAHRREAVRDDAGVRLVGGEVLRDGHLVAPHVRDEDVLVGHRLAQEREGVLDGDVVVLIGRSGDLLDEVLPEVGVPFRVGRPDVGPAERFEPVGDVTDHLDVGDVVFVHLGGFEVEVDDALLALRVPVPRVVFGDVVAHCEHRVRPVDDALGLVLGARIERHQRVVVRVRHRPLPHVGSDDGDVGHINE